MFGLIPPWVGFAPKIGKLREWRVRSCSTAFKDLEFPSTALKIEMKFFWVNPLRTPLGRVPRKVPPAASCLEKKRVIVKYQMNVAPCEFYVALCEFYVAPCWVLCRTVWVLCRTMKIACRTVKRVVIGKPPPASSERRRDDVLCWMQKISHIPLILKHL